MTFEEIIAVLTSQKNLREMREKNLLQEERL